MSYQKMVENVQKLSNDVDNQLESHLKKMADVNDKNASLVKELSGEDIQRSISVDILGLSAVVGSMGAKIENRMVQQIIRSDCTNHLLNRLCEVLEEQNKILQEQEK